MKTFYGKLGDHLLGVEKPVILFDDHSGSVEQFNSPEEAFAERDVQVRRGNKWAALKFVGQLNSMTGGFELTR
jgi:hypothetical protein